MHVYYTRERYYAISLEHDLFGCPVIVKTYGGRHNRLGAIATEPFTRVR